MTPLAADSNQPTEKPTVYRGPAALIGGLLVVLFCGFGAIDLLVESGTKDLVGASILALVGVIAWLYGIYPAAFAWSDRLVVRNPFRTIELSWETVTDLTARLSFMAHTENKRFTVWAIPVSLRERRRAERHKLREMSQVQRAARRGVSPDMFGAPRSRYPDDPIAQLSFADQAIAEMNAKREAHVMKARVLSAKIESERESGAAQPEEGSAAPAELVSVRWAWFSIALLGAAVVFLVVALSLR